MGSSSTGTGIGAAAKAGETPPRVAVIIVNYNSGDMLRRCLAALREQDRTPDRVIVVDNASTDGSLDRAGADWPRVEVLRLDDNTGFAAANNRGLERCDDCEWAALLNPDAFPEPAWLDALMDAARNHPRAGSFASCLVMDEDPSKLDGIGDAYHVSGLVWRIGHGRPRPAGQTDREVFAACAAAAMYRVSALRSIGGFDESYFCYNEDVDVGFRLRLRGFRCWYVPAAVTRHVGSAVTGRHSDFSLYHGHRNLVWTYFKNMPGGLLARYLWQHLLLNVVTILVLSVQYRSTAPLRSKFSALKGMGRVLRQRREIQARRTASNAELLEAMTRGWWRCYFRRRLVE
jgi:GT2 family glycosyltransferase